MNSISDSSSQKQDADSNSKQSVGTLQFNLMHRLRHAIKRIPFANEAYDFITTVFTPDYAEDALRASKNCSFLKDQEFISSYDALLRQEPGRKTRWRSHVSNWAAYQASLLDGDFVETGVNKAGAVAAIMKYLNFHNLADKTFYLFDTYSGLVADVVNHNENAAFKNQYLDCYDFVCKSFKDYPNVKIVKGIVPESLYTVNIQKVAFLSVDMNCEKAERAALEFFWPKLVNGGMVVLDDYAFSGRNPQQESADEFAQKVGRKILTIPTGQGLLIK